MSTHPRQDTTVAVDLTPEWWPPQWALLDGQELVPPRVLVAEPRAELRLQIGHALRQAGMDADFATNCEEAQAMLQRQRYDVAVLNPEIDASGGESLCRALSQGRVPTPLITLSDRDSSMNQTRSVMGRSQARLVRPLSSNCFVGTVWRMARGG